MIRIGIVGGIGSGKSYIANSFGYPVFNADNEVGKIYKKDKKIFNRLKKILPKHIHSFPINTTAILDNKTNLKKIIKIVHVEVRKKLHIFIRRNKNKKIIILDIPLLLENKINKKNDVLIFVESKQSKISKRLKKRKNFNQKLFKKFKNIQLSLNYKKKKSQFVIKNDFTKITIKKYINNILNQILYERSSIRY